MTQRQRYPALRVSRRILAGDLSASKEQVWPRSLLVSGYPGARDANDRCIIEVVASIDQAMTWPYSSHKAMYIIPLCTFRCLGVI